MSLGYKQLEITLTACSISCSTHTRTHTHTARGILISTCEIVIACSLRGKGLWESLAQTPVYLRCRSECFIYFIFSLTFPVPLIDFTGAPSLSVLPSTRLCLPSSPAFFLLRRLAWSPPDKPIGAPAEVTLN